ncbi:protein containing uncharacterized domain HDIG [Bellilinea caldifistulae]|jgi:putative nucleotidyltransferase with HDIG domain|uniref:HDOD domain-containing protein n=1 Tax=Bellilinea caldifistulae TaxID=360411 RepID=A0A0P6XVM6_9CHLR|nr:HDOD domain-containing protein [Bellilinea caldifistulae]KPL77505.1 hypothetical protein AC812_02875 [Bellilinea caldifistulae]GAP09719.1 protein containing uncharacterized domain HDIG [Bellilinea caldifistulae]
MMRYTLDDLIREAGKLPPLPQASQRALELMRSPDCNLSAVADVLAVDQVLSGVVLRVANSAFYGMPNRIATVHQAVVVIGLQALYEIILAASLGSFLNRPLPGYELRKGELWRHSLGVAICARTIAQKRQWKNIEEFYFAGLLSDIGKLALEKLLRSMVFSLNEWQSASFLEIERSYFGIDHAMLGAEMARRWRLPEGLVAVIAHHHNPAAAGPYQAQAYAVHIGDSIMMMLGIGVGRDGLQYALDERAVAALNLTEVEQEELVSTVMDQIEMAEMLITLPGAG